MPPSTIGGQTKRLFSRRFYLTWQCSLCSCGGAIGAGLAQRRFMLVDPNNRLVADTLEGEWNEKLLILAKTREDCGHARERDPFILDEAFRERLIAMTMDFNKLRADPDAANRWRGRASRCRSIQRTPGCPMCIKFWRQSVSVVWY